MKKKYKGRKKIYIEEDGVKKQIHNGDIIELTGKEDLPWNLFEKVSTTTSEKFEEPTTTEVPEKTKKTKEVKKW